MVVAGCCFLPVCVLLLRRCRCLALRVVLVSCRCMLSIGYWCRSLSAVVAGCCCLLWWFAGAVVRCSLWVVVVLLMWFVVLSDCRCSLSVFVVALVRCCVLSLCSHVVAVCVLLFVAHRFPVAGNCGS